MSSVLPAILFGTAAIAFVALLCWLDARFDELKEFRIASCALKRRDFTLMSSCQIGRGSYRNVLGWHMAEDALFLRVSRFPFLPKLYRIPYANWGVSDESKYWDVQIFTRMGTVNGRVDTDLTKALRRRLR